MPEKRLQHGYFPVNIAKFLRAAFYRTPPVAAFKEFPNKSALETGIQQALLKLLPILILDYFFIY